MLRFTFGKYKNQSIHEVFQKDRQYIKWLCSQLWFKNNHYNLYEGSMNEFNEYTPKINKDKFIAYTDGACPNNGNSKARSSIGIHFSEKNSIKLKDVSQPLDMDHHSNNYAEMRAIYECLSLIQKNKINIPIELYTILVTRMTRRSLPTPTTITLIYPCYAMALNPLMLKRFTR